VGRKGGESQLKELGLGEFIPLRQVGHGWEGTAEAQLVGNSSHREGMIMPVCPVVPRGGGAKVQRYRQLQYAQGSLGSEVSAVTLQRCRNVLLFFPLQAQTLKDLFNRLLELGILKRMPARSSRAKATAGSQPQQAPAQPTTASAATVQVGALPAGAADQAVEGAAEATVDAVAPGGGSNAKKA